MGELGAPLPLAASEEINGVVLHRGLLDRPAQEALAAAIRAVARAAPLFRPTTPWGKPMSVQMTAAGRFGWVTDRSGYRYEERHPVTGAPWPPIPEEALAVWRAVADHPRLPDCCLVNYYAEAARMGLHRDADERDFSAPVVSISLGDPAVFRVGGAGRKDPTRSTRLESGDVAVLGGAARLAYHGIDRILFGQSDLLPNGGRINLTLRVAD